MLTDRPENVLFALYNADSWPHDRTFPWVLAQFNALRARSGKTPIFQQYGLYLKNRNQMSRASWLTGGILLSAAFWQTRWSIGFEIFNNLRQFAGMRPDNPMKGRPVLNYCIGHGLFFGYQVFEEFGGFSERTHNEDAMFGLQASFRRVPIIPIPFLELADSAETVRALYIQKSTWFWGPLQAFRYVSLIRQDLPGAKEEGLTLFWLACRLFEHALLWIGGPTLMYTLLALAVLCGRPLDLAIWAVVALTYLALPNWIAVAWCGPGYDLAGEWTAGLRPAVGSLISYFLHGASAYRSLWRAMRSAKGELLAKERTPLKGQ